MARPSDTSPAAHDLQLAIYRRLGGERRVALGLLMADEGRALALAGVAARHPEYSPQEREDAVRALYLGREVFEQVWPGRIVPDP